MAASFLEADEYIISYYSAAKNAQLLNENISISRAMTSCEGTPTSHIILYRKDNDDFKTIIQNNHDAFLRFLQQNDLHVKSFTLSDKTYNDLTTLSMPPQCFTVIINDNFAKISALK